jgi:uncharacterized protein DUF3800
MLRAYIDDSKHDEMGLFVLAGYVADEDKWIEFDREWREILAGPPELHHLKTSDMFQTRNRNSVFWGWSREEVDARVLRFATAVNKYVLASIQTAIRKEDFANILGGLPSDDPSMNRPYPFLFYTIIQGLALRLDDLGVADKVEFYFGMQPDEKMQRLRHDFQAAKSLYQGWLDKKIVGEPQFRDDEKYTPLQAADLIAWHFRKNLAEHEQGRTFASDVWTELLHSELPAFGIATSCGCWSAERA